MKNIDAAVNSKTLTNSHDRRRPHLLEVKELSHITGVSMKSIYHFIKTDPNFPYLNIGARKKYVVDLAEFEKWLAKRREMEVQKIFNIPSFDELKGEIK